MGNRDEVDGGVRVVRDVRMGGGVNLWGTKYVGTGIGMRIGVGVGVVGELGRGGCRISVVGQN